MSYIAPNCLRFPDLTRTLLVSSAQTLQIKVDLPVTGAAASTQEDGGCATSSGDTGPVSMAVKVPKLAGIR